MLVSRVVSNSYAVSLLALSWSCLGAWGLEYMNRSFFLQKRKSRGLQRFREVAQAMLVLAVWKKIGSGAGEGLDRRATDVRAAIG